MMIKIRLSVKTIIEYILMVNIILNFGTPYAHAIGRDYYLPETGAILILILFIMRVQKLDNGLIARWAGWFIPYYVIVVIYLFTRVTQDSWISFIARFMVLLPILTILFCLDMKEGKPYQILEKYMNVMAVIAAISLPLWLLGSQLHIIHPSGSIKAFWGAATSFTNYWGLYFEKQRISIFGLTNFIRNQGPFTEAPMYSLNLVFAIAIYLFFRNKEINERRKKKNSHIKLIVLVIALMTTISTTGYILLALMVALIIMRNMNKRSAYRYMLILLGLPVLLFIVIYVFQNKATTGSWMARLNDFRVGVQAFLDQPLLGHQWNNLDFIRQYRGLITGAHAGFSNSIMKILAEGGLCLFSVYAVPIICAFVKSLSNGHRDINSFMIIFILEFVFTIFTYSFLMLLCLSFFYAYMISPMVHD